MAQGDVQKAGQAADGVGYLPGELVVGEVYKGEIVKLPYKIWNEPRYEIGAEIKVLQTMEVFEGGWDGTCEEVPSQIKLLKPSEIAKAWRNLTSQSVATE